MSRASKASPASCDVGFEQRLHGYMLRAFKDELPKGKALQLGYSSDLTQRLAGLFPDLTVVEPSLDVVDDARKTFPRRTKFVAAPIETYAADQKFDAIFLIHSLEDVADPIAMLSRLRGWLSSHGRLFLVVANANAPSRQIAVEMGQISEATAVTMGEYRNGRRRTYNLSTLKADIIDANLIATKSGGIFFAPFANGHCEALIKSGQIGEEHLEGFYQLGKRYPDLCASIYAVCEPWSGKPYLRQVHDES